MQLEHLPDALANVKQIGTASPWLIVNMALSEVEWGELIDYLSAPAGVGYAAKRPANHPGPYTADFNTIYLEVGNEEWGTQYVPADAAYGQWAHFVLSNAIAGKSYFDASKMKFVVNGFVLEPNFGSAAIAAAPEASFTEAALYTNGNTALSGDAYYQSDLVQVPLTNGPQIDALVAQQQLDAASGRAYGLAAYEEGPGVSSNPGDNTSTCMPRRAASARRTSSCITWAPGRGARTPTSLTDSVRTRYGKRCKCGTTTPAVRLS
jgi:hypothetical protein